MAQAGRTSFRVSCSYVPVLSRDVPCPLFSYYSNSMTLIVRDSISIGMYRSRVFSVYVWWAKSTRDCRHFGTCLLDFREVGLFLYRIHKREKLRFKRFI